jgi:amidophosphoribosyltransferase
VRRKLNAIDLEFRGKNVLLVDDSIVRGTTSQQIIEMAREAGARQACTSPRRRRRCATRTSTASTCRRPENWSPTGAPSEAVAELIGADWLIYLELPDLIRAVRHDHAAIEAFDTSCFSGEYVTGDVTPEYLARLEAARGDVLPGGRVGSADGYDEILAEDEEDARSLAAMR